MIIKHCKNCGREVRKNEFGRPRHSKPTPENRFIYLCTDLWINREEAEIYGDWDTPDPTDDIVDVKMTREVARQVSNLIALHAGDDRPNTVAAPLWELHDQLEVN